MQSLIRLGHHDGWIVWPCYGSSGVKCLSRTQRYIVQFGIRQPCNCLLALLFTELHHHFDCFYYGHNSTLCAVWTSNLQFYDYYSVLYQTEPRRCLTLQNKMFLVSVWHIQVLYNVYIFLFFTEKLSKLIRGSIVTANF